ncbi:MAG: hypothetical protein CR997_12335 [Acidobacteria bacterium]|nr:MAG: hypothetical protein CR997_12335 [Acidobacteriota bacterium]
MKNPPNPDLSVYNEPHMQVQDKGAIEDQHEHAVWDEPAQLARQAPPKGAMSYSKWYAYHKEHTPELNRWLTWILVCLVSGPFAVLSALIFGNPTSVAGLMTLVLIAPIVEEIAKIGAPLVLLETKPYLISNRFQLIAAAMAGGLLFAVIENLLYLFVYIPNPTPEIAIWRWTVCTFMHVGTSTVASLGLVRAWRDGETYLKKPQLNKGFPLFIAAMVIHGSYNALAILLEYKGVFH